MRERRRIQSRYISYGWRLIVQPLAGKMKHQQLSICGVETAGAQVLAWNTHVNKQVHVVASSPSSTTITTTTTAVEFFPKTQVLSFSHHHHHGHHTTDTAVANNNNNIGREETRASKQKHSLGASANELILRSCQRKRRTMPAPSTAGGVTTRMDVYTRTAPPTESNDNNVNR